MAERTAAPVQVQVEAGWRLATLPGAALLGVVLPITFLQRVQSYSHHMGLAELVGAYGTTVLMVLPAALALAGLVLASRGLAGRLAGHITGHGWRGWLRRSGAQGWPEALFAVLVAGALFFGLRQWWLSLGLHESWPLPRAAWAPAAMLVAYLASTRVRRLVQAWHAPARGLAAIGLASVLTVPWLGWPDEAPASRPAGADRPHLVLLTFDALSASRMSVYGSARDTTPALARWAEGGVVMERFYAGSNYTTTALGTLMTGRHAHEHGALQLLSVPARDARAQSLPAVLKAAGYRTLAVSTNPLGGPLKNGFGAYFDAVASDEINSYFSGRDGPSQVLRFVSVALDNPLVNALWRPAQVAGWVHAEAQARNLHFDTVRAYAAAKRLLATPRPAGQPVFLWVHVLPPHSPYSAPAPYLGMYDASPKLRDMGSSTPPFMFAYGKLDDATQRTFEARYDESVRFLDASFEGFVQMIEQALGPRTVVMVSADHGESFSHGYGGHAGPLLNEPLVRVPLLVRGPGVAAGQRLSTVAGHVDLTATLADLAGAEVPSNWRGRSLAAAWRADEAPPDGQALALNLEQSPRGDALRRGTATLITPQWKLVQRLGEPRYAGEPMLPRVQLFHLGQDPNEIQDRSHEQREVLAHMQGQLAAVLKVRDAALRDGARP